MMVIPFRLRSLDRHSSWTGTGKKFNTEKSYTIYYSCVKFLNLLPFPFRSFSLRKFSPSPQISYCSTIGAPSTKQQTKPTIVNSFNSSTMITMDVVHGRRIAFQLLRDFATGAKIVKIWVSRVQGQVVLIPDLKGTHDCFSLRIFF